MRNPIRTQRGTTLVIALIMLVLLTLFAISAMNTANTNLKVVGNMQSRNEALNAAQEAIETTLSTPQFISSPLSAVPNPCGAANTLCADVNGDGVADYTTTLTPPPTCVVVKPIKSSDLVLTTPEDLGCAIGQQQQFGVVGGTSGDSLCAFTIWEINAQTVSATSPTTVNLTQGVSVRIAMDDASSC